ncbi:MAG: hypothetical protein ACR2H6_09945 [Pyrinomonadaceae bacterium]
MIAARVAADLEHLPDVEVQTKKGGLGELSVDLDGKRAFTGSRIWYPTPTSVVEKVRAVLPKKTETPDET